MDEVGEIVRDPKPVTEGGVAEMQTAIGKAKAGRPYFVVNEIVEVKGLRFRVQGVRRRGLVLKTLPAKDQ